MNYCRSKMRNSIREYGFKNVKNRYTALTILKMVGEVE